jgi:hypothetical protein
MTKGKAWLLSEVTLDEFHLGVRIPAMRALIIAVFDQRDRSI